jgi:hypothetical protein
VLDRLLEEPWLRIDAISGTSAGAMDAAVLADGHAAGGAEGARATLVDFWRRVSRAALTGSASGGLTIALDALGETYMRLAAEAGIDPALLHRVAAIGSGTLDSLPHNGAVVTLLAVCGVTTARAISTSSWWRSSARSCAGRGDRPRLGAGLVLRRLRQRCAAPRAARFRQGLP